MSGRDALIESWAASLYATYAESLYWEPGQHADDLGVPWDFEREKFKTLSDREQNAWRKVVEHAFTRVF